MKYRLLILFFLLTCCCLAAQEFEEYEPVDSLNFENPEKPDSLFQALEQDSLFFSVQDSLFYPQTEKPDSLNVVELYKKLQLHLKAKNQMRKDFQLPLIVVKEDFHWKTPFNPNLQISKNGFSLFPFRTVAIHTVQNYAAFYNAVYDQGFVVFSQDNYALPVAVTEVFLGLGDINMNHAAANYRKGKVIGINDLNLEIGYLGMDGKWLGKREKSRNFNGHLFYAHRWGKLHLYYTNLDQEISSNKLATAPGMLEVLKEETSDLAVKWENPYLTLGFRNENAKVDSLKRQLAQILLSKDLQYKDHLLNLRYEYIRNSTDDENFGVVNLAHRSRFPSLDIGNRLIYREKDNYFASSHLKLKIFSGWQLQTILEKQAKESAEEFWQQERLGAGFSWNLPKMSIDMYGGREKIKDEESYFLETRLGISCHTGIAKITLENWSLARNTDIIFLPELQTQSSLEFQFDMQRGNFIKIGLMNVFLSEYYYYHDNAVTPANESFFSFDAWLAFQITSQFQIKLDAVNLTNTKSLFGLPAAENLDGRHFNFNVRWLFIN